MEEGEGAGDEEVGGLNRDRGSASARATAQQLRRCRGRTLPPPRCGHRHAPTPANAYVLYVARAPAAPLQNKA